MLNKLGSNLLLIAAVTCAPLLLLQGIWLAAQATPLTLTLILGTSLLGFGLLFMLAYRARNAERAQQDRVWIKALQLRDPAVLETAEAQAALQQLLSHFNEANLDAHRQIDELHNLATQDELTQLQNRHAFRRDMTALLQRDQDTQTATLVLIRATELGKLNAQRGFRGGCLYQGHRQSDHPGGESLSRPSGLPYLGGRLRRAGAAGGRHPPPCSGEI